MRVARGSISARYVVCFDIPEDAGIAYEQTGEPGHFDIRGNLDALKRYVSDDRFDVERRTE